MAKSAVHNSDPKMSVWSWHRGRPTPTTLSWRLKQNWSGLHLGTLGGSGGGGADILAASPPTSYEQLSNSSSPLHHRTYVQWTTYRIMFLKNAAYVFWDKNICFKKVGSYNNHIYSSFPVRIHCYFNDVWNVERQNEITKITRKMMVKH